VVRLVLIPVWDATGKLLKEVTDIMDPKLCARLLSAATVLLQDGKQFFLTLVHMQRTRPRFPPAVALTAQLQEWLCDAQRNSKT